MAIVINGSGTVTGISVGGLPDDIVDAGTLADNAVGLAQMAGGTDGNIITYDTSGDPAAVATGDSGEVLTSAGADAVPTFAAGGGVWELVGSITSTGNTSVTIGGDSSPVFSSSHDTYVLTGIIRTNQDSSAGMQIKPILAGAGTTADIDKAPGSLSPKSPKVQ